MRKGGQLSSSKSSEGNCSRSWTTCELSIPVESFVKSHFQQTVQGVAESGIRRLLSETDVLCSHCENLHSTCFKTMFPIPRKLKSFQGPHATCLMSAETYIRRYSSRRGDSIMDVYMGRTVAFALYRFLIAFSSGLFSMMGFMLCAVLFALGYASTRLFLRFQYKITVLLVMLQRRPFHFKSVNDALVYTLHVLLLLVGGFGWMSLLFVEM